MAQHDFYHHFLKNKGIQTIYQCKGSPDKSGYDGPLFFGILKSEMFYGYENTFQLPSAWNKLVDYIDYYNNKRSGKLKDLSPYNTELNPGQINSSLGSAHSLVSDSFSVCSHLLQHRCEQLHNLSFLIKLWCQVKGGCPL